MNDLWIWLIGGMLVAGAAFAWYRRDRRPVPHSLRRGHRLPAFEALDEAGDLLKSSELAGTPVVMIFVRGNWCPFCSKQVENLTDYYKKINDLGARLVFVTPKPLETTRRVAEFFQVEFEFWLDESLAATRQLGLLLESGVPSSFEKEYGRDTMWPTSLVVSADGIIRYVELSKHIVDRPNPKTLLRELEKAISG
jgi:peroxiredoxin